MKRMIAALAAVLCLAGCAAKEKQTEVVGVTVVTEQTAEAEPVPKVEEVPVEQVPAEEEEPEALPEDKYQYAVGISTLEGLVGDAVGYVLEYPVVSGLPAEETINEFYTKLLSQLENYAQQTVNEQCLERFCVADVSGIVGQAVLEGELLTIDYTYEVKYSDAEEPEVFTRTDTFQVQTGEVTSVTE